MPGKAGAKGTRYVCPQCFMAHYLNDVLFMARWPSSTCDVRQAAHRYAVEPDAAFAQWCEKGRTPALLNWRALPQSRRQWRDGAIVAVRDIDGSWVDVRVCPCCHTPLPPPCPVVVGWDREGMDGETASGLLRFAAETADGPWKVRRDDSRPLAYDYLVNPSGAVLLGVPVALERTKGRNGKDYRRRCCESASGAVVRLKVQVDEDGEWDDYEALCTLEALLEACAYADARLNMSVLFLLEGPEDREDVAELFPQKCPQLARLIQYDFKNSYFAVGVCDRPQVAVQAVKWLSGHISRLNTEE